MKQPGKNRPPANEETGASARKSPRETFLGYIFLILFIGVIGGATWLFNWNYQRNVEQTRKEDLRRDQRLLEEIIHEHPYGELLTQLDATSRQLRALIGFMDSQKVTIQKKEALIAQMGREEDRLRKIVEANRSTVAAILEEEARKRAAAAWRERLISFALGVISSLLAACLYTWWPFHWGNG